MEKVRRLNLGIVVLAVVVSAATAYASVVWLLQSQFVKTVQSASFGFVNGTLIANVLQMVVVIGFILMYLGKARFMEIGLMRHQFVPALLFTVLTWIAFQFAMIIFHVLVGNPILIRPEYQTAAAAMPHIGVLISQLFGNALFEECLFRGVLLVQLVIWFCPRQTEPDAELQAVSPSQRRSGVAVAWILSQFVFSLQHIPHRLRNGSQMSSNLLMELVILFLIGLVFASIFWRTKNLMLVVGFHALANAPTCLFIGPEWLPALVLTPVAILCLLLGPKWQRVGQHKANSTGESR